MCDCWPNRACSEVDESHKGDGLYMGEPSGQLPPATSLGYAGGGVDLCCMSVRGVPSSASLCAVGASAIASSGLPSSAAVSSSMDGSIDMTVWRCGACDAWSDDCPEPSL